MSEERYNELVREIRRLANVWREDAAHWRRSGRTSGQRHEAADTAAAHARELEAALEQAGVKAA